MELNKAILKDIIEGFAREGKIFSNEAQFQFAFAWAIKNNDKTKNANVMLEQPIFLKNKNDDTIIEKMYIDIIVELDGKYYPIELKYKTAAQNKEYEIKNTKYYTFTQGATESGSYDFIWDIKRLERLFNKMEDKHYQWKSGLSTTSKEDIILDYTSLGKSPNFKTGFAIIITNNPNYNKNRKADCFWKNFSLVHNRNLSGKLSWFDAENDCTNDFIDLKNDSVFFKKVKSNCGQSRCKPIDIKGAYTLNWKTYPIEGLPEKEFQYMIIPIAKQKDAPETV